MMFSVVIPTRDRPALLERILIDLARQTLSREEFEVIVVNDASTEENTSKLQAIINNLDLKVQQYLNIRNVGPARSRNLGISRAKGDWIAFTDDDVRIPPDWLQIARDKIRQNPGIIGIEGKITTDKINPLVHSVQNVKGEYSKRYEGFLTANMFYRRSALLMVGRFDEAFPSAFREDSDLAFRILDVGRVPYCDDLEVFHPSREITLLEAIRREMRHESDPLLNKQHPDKYPYLFARTNLLWLILVMTQFLGGVVGMFVPWTVLGINVFWFLSVLATLGFFVLGRGLSTGIYRWLGSYVRFYAFLRGSIRYGKWFSIISLAFKARKFKLVLTDNI